MHPKFSNYVAAVSSILIVAAALVIMHGCSGLQQQSATQQIINQTKDMPKAQMVIYLAEAAYYDVAGVYEITAESYLQNKQFLEQYRPEINKVIQENLNKMKEFLDDWAKLDAVARVTAIDINSTEFSNLRRQILFDLAVQIDKEL